MTFNSALYFLFLPLVWVTFQLVTDRYRWVVLLVASYLFYAALKVPYLLAVLVAVTLVTYATGRALGHPSVEYRRQWVFWGGVGANLLVLASLKYLPFLACTINAFAPSGAGRLLQVFPALVAIGVSYFVFQGIAYIVDVYLDFVEPEQHLGRFALYLAFFPKLLQGPIERAGDLLPQLRTPYTFDYENVRAGMLLFAWGMFKKVVIADRAAVYVNTVYGDVHSYQGISLLLATYCYAIQIYCDFSGYTDMALGSALIFNIRLTQNFNSPYLATSIADFWRRWHISFSRWILDYIFKPLQMRWRDWKTNGTALALVVTFIVSGIWHGATWGFVVWGTLHGVFLAASVYYKPYQKKLHKQLNLKNSAVLKCWQIFITFHLVCAAWVFFRANSIPEALYVFKHLPDISLNLSDTGAIKRMILMGQSTAELKSLILSLGIFAVVAIFRKRFYLLNMNLGMRWACYVTLALLISLLSYNGQYNFVYFQF